MIQTLFILLCCDFGEHLHIKAQDPRIILFIESYKKCVIYEIIRLQFTVHPYVSGKYLCRLVFSSVVLYCRLAYPCTCISMELCTNHMQTQFNIYVKSMCKLWTHFLCKLLTHFLCKLLIHFLCKSLQIMSRNL